VAETKLEQALRDLPNTGTLLKDRHYRKVWRFEQEGAAYYLKFYPREGRKLHGLRERFRRMFRGSPAVNEFLRLQMLQRAGIPAPRSVAVLPGFRLRESIGDAVIIQAIEPSIQLDQYLNQFQLRGERAPDHGELSKQVREIVHQLVRNKLGHEDLHLGNFLRHEGKLYLLDGYAVRRGMRAKDIYRLAHSAALFGTRTDLMRAWKLLVGGRMPRRNPMSAGLRREYVKRIRGGSRYVGRFESGEWSGLFFRSTKFPKRWSDASRLHVERTDWEREFPRLLERLDKDQLEILKRSPSGDVLADNLTVGGTALPVIVKRPRRRYWYRYLNEIGRGSRAWRAWIKAWSLILRNLPTAWPLLVVEKRKLGYVTDSVIVFERVPGPTLRRVNLDALGACQRDMLFRRAGRILRVIDETGLSHFDAKASNWIVRPDEKLGPFPVMIDPDAVRFRRWLALGIRRLLRSMKEHEQYTVADSLSLCQGYAPYAVPFQEGEPAGHEPSDQPAAQAE
jgi:tRNA A-37 threonylcarbamoyl transferase component Bud32